MLLTRPLNNSFGKLLPALMLSLALSGCSSVGGNVSTSIPTQSGPNAVGRAFGSTAASIDQGFPGTEKVIYSFAGGSAGSFPSNLIDVNGMLFGTTYEGGDIKSNCAGDYAGCGTVFNLTTSGVETVIHNFKPADAALPIAGLLNVGGTLYGTTLNGGPTKNCPAGCGAVFAVTTSGQESTLYEFKGGADGAFPNASLINVNGTLYGTTTNGGSSNKGTVFQITTSGKETVVHSFGGGMDGANPYAELTDVGGTLYGTTSAGGTKNIGTVFKVTLSGQEGVLHNFAGSPTDGGYPLGGLRNVNGVLYGTTQVGGTKKNGTVFKVTLSGQEGVLHNFAGAPADGSDPQATLIDVNGKLYGTTSMGGSSRLGDGTIFVITTSGQERLLHNFTGSPDGSSPRAQLVDVGGTLYGTTVHGGAYSYGAVFRVQP